MQHEFMERAIELARQSQSGPFGCVVVKDGEIVGEGYARPFQDCDPTAHGEIVALRAAARRLGTPDLSGCEVYNIALSCPMCMAAMYWARVDRLYYCCVPAEVAGIGFDNVAIDEQLRKPVAERSLPMVQVPHLRPEALAAFRAFADRPDRRMQSALPTPPATKDNE